MNLIDLKPVLPEIFIACAAMALLMVGAFKTSHGDGRKRSFLLKLTILSLVITGIVILYTDFETTVYALNNFFILDKFAVFIKIIILLSASLILVISFDFLRLKEKPCFELSVLVLLAVLGMMVMVSANDLLSLYMGLEVQSLSLYVLTAINRHNEKSSEAGLKYFMLGVLASGILLYGCSLIYGFTGTTNFTELSKISTDAPIAVLVGVILVIIGICFKVSAVPFHMWTPDVYEGAPKTVTAFFATAPKIAAFALFVRVTTQPFGGISEQWQQIVIFISIASMIVGAFGALRQTNIKRLMAYSSIGHIGFMLIGVAALNQAGIEASLIYVAIYMIMNIGVFTCIMLMKRRDEHVEEIGDLAGISRNSPMFTFIMAVLMLSMAGIPPMAGFFGKLFVFQSALQAELYTLAVLGVLTSVVGAFYYLRIIKIMYFDELVNPLDKDFSVETKFVLVCSGLINLLFFIYPTPLLNAAKIASKVLL